MSKHKKHIPKSDSFLKRIFSSEQSKEDYTDLEWEAKQGLEQLGEDGVNEALANIHKRIESQKSRPSKKRNAIPLWRYAAAAACAGILIVIGNQIINSTSQEGPISYDAQETQAQEMSSDEGSAPSTEAIQETFTDESSSMKDGVKDDATSSSNSERETQSNAIPTAPPPPPAEPVLRLDGVEELITAEADQEERIFEVASEDMVVLELPNDLEDNSTSQASAVIEQEENPPVAYMKDEMDPGNVMADEVAPAPTHRTSETASLSKDNITASDAPEPEYDWSSAFANDQFQEITKRFEESNWAEQHTNEEAMFYAARAYYALGNLDKAKAIMQEVVDLSGEKVRKAQGFLEEWKE